LYTNYYFVNVLPFTDGLAILRGYTEITGFETRRLGMIGSIVHL